jgi:outer membrane protein
MSKKHTIAAATALALATGAAFTTAASAQDWGLKIGVHNFDPKSNNGTLAGLRAEVQDDAQVTGNVLYYLDPHLALDFFLSAKFDHDINLGGETLASTKHLPFTLTLQYQFDPQGSINPYVGAGINYTRFSNERIAFDDSRLSLDNSLGIALQAGVDFELANNVYLGANIYWMDVDSKAKLNGERIGTARIDPLVYGVNVGVRF